MNKYTVILFILVILFFIIENTKQPLEKNTSTSGLDEKLNNSYIVKKSNISEQLEDYMKKDTENSYIDNKVLSGELKLKSLNYLTPNNKLDTNNITYINPHNKPKIKNIAKVILPRKIYDYIYDTPYYNKVPQLQKPDEFYEMKSECKDKAIRRCKLPPIHSTRCYLNECELSTYNQCTNNVHTQNSCECKANDLCKEPDRLRNRCYKQRYNDCENKSSVNKYR